MAHMIPSLGPAESDVLSNEDEIYYSLAKLPDEYWVLHSCQINSLSRGRINQAEADFIIFHRRLGIMCIEAKYTHPKCLNGEWLYQSGKPMKHGGPYRQADRIKWKILDLFNDMDLSGLREKCKVVSAVWFHAISSNDLNEITFPPEAMPEITFCKEDLLNPEKKIKDIFNIAGYGGQTSLSKEESDLVLQKILCPSFEIVPILKPSRDYTEFIFLKLLESQVKVLKYLEDQRSAVVNGAAGTGKTLLAIERAKRASKTGKVLFLCYNRLLMEDVREKCADTPSIEVYSLDSFAIRVCNGSADYSLLADRLVDWGSAFPYLHVVIDEGQDFGRRAVDDTGILEMLYELVLMKPKGTMYLFYDRRQLIQAGDIPSFADKADSKITLYVNCRNTEPIANCSMNAIGDSDSIDVHPDLRIGCAPKILITKNLKDQEEYIDSQINELRTSGVNEIVILTCKTVQRSCLTSLFNEKPRGLCWKRTNVPVYTCRTFKGLEAQAIILIDVDEHLWTDDGEYDAGHGMLFYAGASRAKHELRVLCNMDDLGCKAILKYLGVQGSNKPAKKLAKELNADLVRL